MKKIILIEDETSVVSFIKSGKTVITATTSNNISATYNINVVENKVEKLVITTDFSVKIVNFASWNRTKHHGQRHKPNQRHACGEEADQQMACRATR